MDYDLSGLSSRSFEQMAQALVAAAIGPDVIVFGDGPDGGREATYEGRIPYPSPGNAWNGYTVVQAKFCQQPGSSKADASWLLAQLRKEFADYGNPARRRPDNILFITNIKLTPVKGSGSKDRVTAFMGSETSKLGIKGWDIWDYDKLRTLLDNNADIRQGYSAWITPGDVLAAVMNQLKTTEANFESTIINYLQKELISDVYANLEQAGHAAEDKIPLATVFVDLPLAPSKHNFSTTFESQAETAGIDGEADPLSAWPGQSSENYFVSCMIAEASSRYDRSAGRDASKSGASNHMGTEGRYVLLGGPGQGKSTLGQFLCQIYRAVLLEPREGELSAEAQSALATVRARLDEDSLPTPRGRRFPLRIPLNAYAAALAKENGPTGVLSYLVYRINERVGCELSHSTFRQWLTHYPWLLVLDGLDEVPSSSNRDAVLASIADFWVDVATAGSDVFVVATTRPQGYGDDFSPAQYRHIGLRSLAPVEALRYGKRLAATRYGGDDERLEKVVGRLTRATREDATQRLMQSPLQVTIMTALLDRMGQPPQNRWGLFREYYNVIYVRELEKAGDASEILRDYQPDIDAIHRRVGLLLQVKSERTRQTEARLTQSDLAAVIRTRLRSEGHSDNLDALTDEILTTASERLVFLVGMENEHRIGFEVRSLQEFMAAECLMDGPDEIVAERLRLVAGVTSWRNVVLFAMGRCFGDRQYLRDSVFALCAHLNSDPEDQLAAYQRTGAKLAVDMLIDGSARRQPRYQQMFAREALDVLRLPVRSGLPVLCDLYEESLEDLYRERVGEAVRSTEIAEALGGWQSLLRLEVLGVEWATDVIDSHWPKQPEALEVLARNADIGRASDHIIAKVAEYVPKLPVAFALSCESAIAAIAKRLPAIGWVHYFTNHPERDGLEAPVRFIDEGEFLLSVVPTTGLHQRGNLTNLKDTHSSWLPLIAGDVFSRNPTAKTLARALRQIGAACQPEEWHSVRGLIPWPLASCLATAVTSGDIDKLAAAAEAGRLGDIVAWRAAERRWQQNGVHEDDLMHMDAVSLPFDQRIAGVGYPISACGWSVAHDGIGAVVNELTRIFDKATRGGLRSTVGEWLVSVAAINLVADEQADIGLDAFGGWLKEMGPVPGGGPWIDREGLQRAGWLTDDAENARILDEIGRRCRLAERRTASLDFASRLVGLAVQHPDHDGLWRMTVLALASLEERAPDELFEKLSLSDTPDASVTRAYQSAIKLVEGGEEDELERAARGVAVALRLGDPVFRTALTTLINLLNDRPDAAGVAIPVLGKELDVSEVETHKVLGAVADDVLRRRTSPLWEAAQWQSVGLFERDESVFEG
jgi:hypothetical protein